MVKGISLYVSIKLFCTTERRAVEVKFINICGETEILGKETIYGEIQLRRTPVISSAAQGPVY